MDRQDIIRMARESGLADSNGVVHAFFQLEYFAYLVAAHEREACSKVVEDYCGAWDDEGYALSATIRARGNSETHR